MQCPAMIACIALSISYFCRAISSAHVIVAHKMFQVISKVHITYYCGAVRSMRIRVANKIWLHCEIFVISLLI